MPQRRPSSIRYHKPALVALLVLLAASLLVAGHTGAAGWQAAVDPALLATLDQPGQLEFIVRLKDRADISQAAGLQSKEAKGTYVVATLRETAERSQRVLVAELAARDVDYQSFWIVNALLVRADADTLRQLAVHSDVEHIYANPHITFSPPSPDQNVTSQDATTVEWGVQLIGAPELWALGIDGQDVVIGGQDTGYDWQHPALKNQYRGWDGQVAEHDYNWHDAIHASSGPCGSDSPEPCDDNGHGTHTMGTMVGDDGGSNQIGVAPGARWIGCRNMDSGVGTPATYIECFQWFMAPTEIGSTIGDPTKAPHVINNSWSCPPYEGCADPDILREVVEAVRAAGILTVQSAGNSGSSCGSISTAAAIYDATFTVGATTSADVIASFSSRGPVQVDGSNRLKPDVVAPGVSIRSSYLNGGYTYLSGTSMASPHVAGIAALLISANADLAGDVDQLENIIKLSAIPKQSAQGCDPYMGDQVPNAVYGYGRVDSVAALRLLYSPRSWLPLIFTASAPTVYPDLAIATKG